MPERIQRRRTKGWRLPENTVIVDRSSRWGNPFRVEGPLVELLDGRMLACSSNAAARREAAAQFEAWLDGAGPAVRVAGRNRFDRRRILAELPSLRGRDLACTCPLPEPGQPDHCHAAELIRRSNPEVPDA